MFQLVESSSKQAGGKLDFNAAVLPPIQYEDYQKTVTRMTSVTFQNATRLKSGGCK
jgi:hypothetical protein